VIYFEKLCEQHKALIYNHINTKPYTLIF